MLAFNLHVENTYMTASIH